MLTMDYSVPEEPRAPHILFTHPNAQSSSSTCCSATGSDDDLTPTSASTPASSLMSLSPSIQPSGLGSSNLFSAAPISNAQDDTLLAMQELRINTTHPLLTHTLRQEQSSVLSLAANAKHIFSGSQGKDIYVWDRSTLAVTKTLRGHSGSVLMLELSEPKEWLFSSSSDSTVRIWSTSSLTALFVIHPHGETDAGDIYSLAFSYTPAPPSRDDDDQLKKDRAILFFGCQNTSLQWIDLSSTTLNPIPDRPKDPRLEAVLSGEGDTTESSDYDYGAELEYEYEFDLDSEEDEQEDEEAILVDDHPTDDSQPGPSRPRSQPSLRKRQSTPRTLRPPKKPHKFFDSQPRGSQSQLPTLSAPNATASAMSRVASSSSIDSTTPRPSFPSSGPRLKRERRRRPRVLRVPPSNVLDSAHYGYIYCMTLVPPPTQDSAKPFGDYVAQASPSSPSDTGPDEFEDKSDVIRFVSGSGDEDVKLWSFDPSSSAPAPVCQHTFNLPPVPSACPGRQSCGGAVLSVLVKNNCVYAGCQDGLVVVWGLEDGSLVRCLVGKEHVDVLSLSLIDTDLYTCLSDGEVHRYSGSFARTAAWKAHDGIVLSSMIVPCTSSSTPPSADSDASAKAPYVLMTGANDNHIKLWGIERPPPLLVPASATQNALAGLEQPDAADGPAQSSEEADGAALYAETRAGRGVSNEAMVQALTEFVSIPSVTASETYREFCRQAAIWLRASFAQLGAEAYFIPPVVEGKNPLVLGTFKGKERPGQKKPRVLFYGHYDVIPAPTNSTSNAPSNLSVPPPASSWRSHPFTLTGVNGYLYGRGVTDNKGPIIAAASGVASLLARGELECDVVFLIEGEEEAGSGGFELAVKRWKERIGDIDAILLSNSYWIDDKTPCITFGLRGVVQASLEISSGCSDLHSGVEGGAWNEPMLDMIKLLATLSGPDSKIAIPSFYDAVLPLCPSEGDTYQSIAELTGSDATKIASRWREPSLTVHNIAVSGSNNPTVIPSTVKAQVSIRIVPDQSLQTVIDSLQAYLRDQFAAIGTTNKLMITIDRSADWWLGQLHDPWFRSLEQSVRDEWGVQPLHIREGGSIPSIPFLEKEFGCHALHLPMGQSSDQAHLQNERISLNNLFKGRSVIERFFRSVPDFVKPGAFVPADMSKKTHSVT